MAGEQPPTSLRIHAELFFEIWNELRDEGLSPRPIIHRVGELMSARRAVFSEKNPDHLRDSFLRHHLGEIGSGALHQAAQVSAESVSKISSRITLLAGRVTGRQDYQRCNANIPSPKRRQCRADEINKF